MENGTSYSQRNMASPMGSGSGCSAGNLVPREGKTSRSQGHMARPMRSETSYSEAELVPTEDKTSCSRGNLASPMGKGSLCSQGNLVPGEDETSYPQGNMASTVGGRDWLLSSQRGASGNRDQLPSGRFGAAEQIEAGEIAQQKEERRDLSLAETTGFPYEAANS